MKRVNGYVIGRKSHHGISTWSVRIREEGHELNGQKLIVASVAKGVTLSNGLDVDFLFVNRSGLPMAADVSPRGVVSAHEEGTKAMIRSTGMRIALYSIAAAIAVGMMVYAVMFAQINPLKDSLLEVRVSMALRAIQATTSFDELIPDNLIAQAVMHGGTTYAAREAFYDEHMCPAFGDTMSDYGNADKPGPRKCWNAVYDAKLLNAEDSLKRDGLPGSIGLAMKMFRSTAFEAARKYLSNPGRLHVLYEKKKAVASANFRMLDRETQKSQIENIRQAKAAFDRWLADPAVREANANYLKAQKAHYALEYGVPGYEEAYQADQEAFRALERFGNVYWIQYAARRFAEGGDTLVWEYAWMAGDTLKEIGVSAD